MNSRPAVDEADLHALVDDEISGEERRRVEDHLLQHPEDAALVEGWRRQNAALRAAFEPVAQERPPLSLRNAALRGVASGTFGIETGVVHWGRPGGSGRSVRRLDDARAKRRARAVASWLFALIVGAVLAGAAVFQFTKGPSPAVIGPVSLAQGYVERAEIAYRTYADDPLPVEMDAVRGAQPLKSLRRKLGFAHAPDLSASGLRLLGGRAVPGLRAPAGLLIYERTDGGGRIALFYERAESVGGPRLAPRLEPPLTAVEWRGAGYAFVLIGPLEPDAMQQAAERAAGETQALLGGAQSPR
jgi:anti-sigma factor RsiW